METKVNLEAILLFIVGLFVIVVLIICNSEIKDCDDKGGVMIDSVWTYECVKLEKIK